LDIIEAFIVANPSVKLRISNDNHGTLYDQLRQELDLAFVIEPELDDQSASEVDYTRIEGFERLILHRRRVKLLIPEEHPWAEHSKIELEHLRGGQIVALDRTHGVALSEVVARKLIDAGAELIRSPERHPFAVERYSHFSRIPSVSLGWFQYPPFTTSGAPMVIRDVEIQLTTSLALVRSNLPARPAATAFWKFAAAFKDPVGAS
jgi:LysR substrate binding domain